jgi:hypothetical protein
VFSTSLELIGADLYSWRDIFLKNKFVLWTLDAFIRHFDAFRGGQNDYNGSFEKMCADNVVCSCLGLNELMQRIRHIWMH